MQWADINGEQINVRRTVWRNQEGPTKTRARSAPVPLLPIVRDALNEHRRNIPATKYVFEGPSGRALDLARLGSKTIKPILEANGIKWHGWHALRRGLATNLHAKGVLDKVIQSLLRHSSLAVTMAHYVKTLPDASVEAMHRLEPAQTYKN